MLEIMQRLYGKKIFLQEAVVPTESGTTFWHTSVVDHTQTPISGGFGCDKYSARKIAISEFLERMNFQKFSCDVDLSKHWGLDIIPTGCGFAVGFNYENTIFRSVAEGYERWAMSKWIDEDFCFPQIRECEVLPCLDSASKFFLKQFDSVHYFKKEMVAEISGRFIKIEIVVTVGFKDGGAFIGSASKLAGQNSWQHSLLESYRHLLAFKNNLTKPDRFPTNKIHFFARNADVALEQIYRPKKSSWPSPKIKFHRWELITDGNYFLARTILDEWQSWKDGPLRRFLY